MPHQLPPLNALRIFEVTARAGSYTDAARELHLTHGAVSRQIQLLERALGQPLFRKEGQRMVATAHARAYAREISAAFDHIGDASRRYGKAATSKVIRVNAPATLAMRWLIPRLVEFRRSHPQTEVRVSTAFSSEPVLKGSFDVAIRRTPSDETQFETTPLFHESATVIASPALLQSVSLKKPRDLAKAVLLSTETRPGDWEAWLEAAGCGGLRGTQHLRFDHFFVTLQAVVDGMGLGIGPFPTLSNDCTQSRIATPFPACQIPGSLYYAMVPMDSDKPKFLREFLQWLFASADAEQAHHAGS
ncbi:LysR substrate-binding domain-containing protein [Pseudorhodoferax sp. Leaf267]|uniref:LysR substrate-binding domain-containing protein n=1 Tax=Pseudorhodoferax sp. Leaf267 TaxID=1736316 RepID=UPI0006FD39CB|nr:LysR substrate-binding domain-containing protein [Pseudorhodoferax sp. Leaf267]KQP12492.1 LysR family transcriptional regulator [Pseudorhodoferax sp. Leaf267]